MGRRAHRIRFRTPSIAKEVKLSDIKRTEVVLILQKHYKDNGVEDDKIDQLIEENIHLAEIGWPRAPKDILLRLQKKTRYPFAPTPAPKQKTSKITSQSTKGTNHSFEPSTIQQVLKPDEQTWWSARLAIYIEEFEFNKSSDIAILEQIMVEELLQRRLSIQQLQNPQVDSMISKTQSESLKRLLDLQTKLGITREQRESSLANVDGNIANIAVMLDEKMDEIEKERKRQIAEEEIFQTQKNAEVPINVLPSPDKLANMLGTEMVSLTGHELDPVNIKITPFIKNDTSQIN